MAREPLVLGLSVSHNGAACLMRGDVILCSVQEERLNRRKRSNLYARERHTSQAVEYCLRAANVRAADLDMVVVCAQGYRYAALEAIKREPILLNVPRERISVIPHHFGHAIHAFSTSGYAESLVIVADGVGSPFEELLPHEQDVCKGASQGDGEHVSVYRASRSGLKCLEKHFVKHGRWIDFSREEGLPQFGSLGGVFSAASKYIFGDYMEAGKVMGLAPYGKPVAPSREICCFQNGEFTFSSRLSRVFEGTQHWPESQQSHAGLAATVQSALEETLLAFFRHCRHYEQSHVCYTGGVALNAIANQRLLHESGFSDMYIPAATEDSGCAIGAAAYGVYTQTNILPNTPLGTDQSGRLYAESEILEALNDSGVTFKSYEDASAVTAQLLADGKLVGWFTGGSELGPRALGQRSILCDARRGDAKEILNSRVKFRESFRPFAPAILAEHASEWLDLGKSVEAPFMVRICPVWKERRHLVPGIVHVDGTARPQTVTSQNGTFHQLLSEFHRRTGVPLLINTSFNVMGEPIVETPADAIRCFLETGLDVCVIENYIAMK